MIGWWTQFEDGTNTGPAADHRSAIQLAAEEYQAAQGTKAVSTSSKCVKRFLFPGAAACGFQPENCTRAEPAVVSERAVERAILVKDHGRSGTGSLVGHKTVEDSLSPATSLPGRQFENDTVSRGTAVVGRAVEITGLVKIKVTLRS